MVSCRSEEWQFAREEIAKIRLHLQEPSIDADEVDDLNQDLVMLKHRKSELEVKLGYKVGN